eukprot:11176325-Lingulodinium_polyedra.AAC.1
MCCIGVVARTGKSLSNSYVAHQLGVDGFLWRVVFAWASCCFAGGSSALALTGGAWCPGAGHLLLGQSC